MKRKRKESSFQNSFIAALKQQFPGCIVFKTDPTYIQGFPDLMMLHQKEWVAFECKRESNASRQPNQPYYVEKLNSMSHAYFVCPENEEAVLDELQRSLKHSRKARVPKSK